MSSNKLVLVASVIWVSSLLGSAGAARDSATEKPVILERGPNHRVVQYTSWQTDGAGRITARTNTYIELETGMHFRNDQGEWEESTDEIQMVGGNAMALKGNHKVIFAPNLASVGVIDLETSDHKRLRSHILGLSYFDAKTGQAVLIAEPKDSIGQLEYLNRVAYADAFDDVKADVEYVNTKAGLEQNVILREQPPAPEKFGLNPATTQLQILTEFMDPPVPVKMQTTDRQAGVADEQLSFGEMTMGLGKAYVIPEGREAKKPVRVTKQWVVLEGRTFLIEEIPIAAAQASFQGLPKRTASLSRPKPKGLGANVIAALRPGLPKRLARKPSKPVALRVAGLAAANQPGFLIDWQLVSDTTDFTFQGNTTYYVTNTVNLSGLITIEGGAVVKFATNTTAQINLNTTTLVLKTTPYRPAIFTALDDDSVGEIIPGSSGMPVGGYGGGLFYRGAYLGLNGPIHDVRFAHLNQALALGWDDGQTFGLADAQFIKCRAAIFLMGGVHLGNCLFYKNDLVFTNTEGETFWYGEHLTVAECGTFNATSKASLYVTNSLLVAVTNFDASGICETYTNQVFQVADPAATFQTVGAASCYLSANSVYRNCGATNLSTDLSARLKQKTTYPPVVLSDLDITNDIVLSPQILRDTDVPDLGYHYDPIDYLLAGVSLNDASVSVYPGTVLAFTGTTNRPYGLDLGDDARFVCKGLATNWNHIIAAGTDQESSAYAVPTRGLITDVDGNASSLLDCRFTDWSVLRQDAPHLAISNRTSVLLRDCQFHSGALFLNYQTPAAFIGADLPLLAADPALNNCLLDAVNTFILVGDGSPTFIQNNLFLGGTFDFRPFNTDAIVQNNFFNQTVIPDNSAEIAIYNGGYNAFLTNYDRLLPISTDDLILPTSIAFQAGPLGNYYQPSTSPLLNAGSTNADALGLYDYTVRSNLVSGAQIKETNSIVDIGYHYVAVDTNGTPVSTYTNGLPDYLVTSSTSEIPDWWLWHYLGNLSHAATEDYDADGTNILAEFGNGIDPNKISFAFAVPNQYVSTNLITGNITIWGGVPANIAVLVDSTNFTGVTWSNYSATVTVNLGATDGPHTVWIGLRGLPDDAQPTWQETTLVLDTIAPTIGISSPDDNSSFGVSRVNVRGTFVAAGLKQIVVNGVPAFVSGLDFDALNVPLEPGTNLITAVIECLNGRTNATSITIVANTNSVGELVDPVQLSADPVGGFTPLPVTFTVQTNLPGSIYQVLYDWNGDDVIDLVTNSLTAVSHTYTNGEYFPVVTIETSAGWFSSSGGWNSYDPNRMRINVQAAATIVATISITDPVDLQWTASSNLYVLSGSTAAIYEFDADGNTNRWLSGIGTNPSGLGVDADGNVYVAVTASNQVWKFIPTETSFEVDTNFGIGGCIGLTNGASGTNNSEFNAPFDVAVSPDGGGISVSDSGNHRIQQFSAAGAFLNTFGSQGTNTGQFNTPKGLTYDSGGTLYIADSGNDRIVLATGLSVEAVTGTNGASLGQLSGPVGICVSERGGYVADIGNNRIQSFSAPVAHNPFTVSSSTLRFAITSGLSQPTAVAVMNTFTNDLFYVADKGNNRVVLYAVVTENPFPAWTNMVALATTGDVSGAVANFSVASVDQYRQAFLSAGTTNTITALNEIGPLIPVFIKDDTAQFYFEHTIAGQTITFPVEFVKENGRWKILEF